MNFNQTAIDLSEVGLMDIGAVVLTTLIIFGILGPKLWRELAGGAKGKS